MKTEQKILLAVIVGLIIFFGFQIFNYFTYPAAGYGGYRCGMWGGQGMMGSYGPGASFGFLTMIIMWAIPIAIATWFIIFMIEQMKKNSANNLTTKRGKK